MFFTEGDFLKSHILLFSLQIESNMEIYLQCWQLRNHLIYYAQPGANSTSTTRHDQCKYFFFNNSVFSLTRVLFKLQTVY